MQRKLSLAWAGAAVASAALTVTFAGCGNGGATSSGGSGSSGGSTVATVGSDNISRDELHSTLEATAGEQALRQLIEYRLVQQQVKSKGMEVTDAEVEAVIKERTKQNPSLTEMIQAGGPRLEEVRRQIRNKIAMDKLITQEIKVNDADFKTWFSKNRHRFDVPARLKVGILLTSTKKRAEVMAEQLKNKSKTFLQLVEEQKKAQDPVAKNSTDEDKGYLSLAKELPPALRDPLSKLKSGEISSVLALGTGPNPVYGVVRVVSREEAQKADIEQQRAYFERLYKLEQVAKRVVKQGFPPNTTFDQALKQAEMMASQQMAQSGRMERLSYAELIDFVNQQAAQQQMQQLMTTVLATAKVEIKDPAYVRVAEAFKPAPAMPGAPGDPGAPGSGPGAPGGPGAPSAPPASGGAAPPVTVK